MLFRDRADAGTQLGRHLDALGVLQEAHDPIILALPRGGVPVAERVAHELALPFDVLNVRKLGAPGQPELAIGAVAGDGALFVDADLVATLGVTRDELAGIIAREREELQRRTAGYRGMGPPPAVRGRTVIVVDDGIATGATMRVALEALNGKGPELLMAAAPVASGEAVITLQDVADEVVCLEVPEAFRAVGEWYADFRQVTDEEVLALLKRR